MLRARLLDGTHSRTWVDKIPGIMLSLNAMAHEPHGFSASMIGTAREPTLPPDLESNACTSPSLDDPATYVDALKQRFSLTHQQMAPPPAPAATNPYREGSLIFVLTTPPERTKKMAPRWKGPFMVKRVPTLIRWCMKMVRLGEPFTLTTPNQPNSRPRDSPHPYPHLNLLGQLLVTSLANLLLLLLNQPPLQRVPLLRPHHQRPPRPLLHLLQASS